MHIIKLKTKITDLLLGQIRPGVGKLRPVIIFSCDPRKPQTNNLKN